MIKASTLILAIVFIYAKDVYSDDYYKTHSEFSRHYYNRVQNANRHFEDMQMREKEKKEKEAEKKRKQDEYEFSRLTREALLRGENPFDSLFVLKEKKIKKPKEHCTIGHKSNKGLKRLTNFFKKIKTRPNNKKTQSKKLAESERGLNRSLSRNSTFSISDDSVLTQVISNKTSSRPDAKIRELNFRNNPKYQEFIKQEREEAFKKAQEKLRMHN